MKENLVTEKYLDQKLSAFVTKEYFEKTLEETMDRKFDEFARMIAGEFKNVRQDIYDLEVKMNDGFEQVDRRFEKMEAHFGRMEIRYGHLDEVVIKDHTPRLRRLEDELGI